MYKELSDDMLTTNPIHPNTRTHVSSPDVGCIFPDVDPFSPVAMKYNRDMPKVTCKGKDWVECNMSECYVKKEILDTKRDITCVYKDIIYIDDDNYKIGDGVKLSGDEKYILNQSDYFKVSCFGYDKKGFGLLSHRWQGYIAGVRQVNRSVPASRENSLNVLILGFDSTSRNGFVRKMPKSYRVLVDELGAVIMNGYNIVGDGTPDALFPALSGRHEWQHASARRVHTRAKLDPDLFIFKEAADDGYQTAYYEDMPWIGSFQYRYNGFSKRPADHYLRPFLMEEAKAGTKWWTGTRKRYCIGAKPQYKVLLDLTKQFISIKSKTFCFTFIADISHDQFDLISTADDDLVDFMRHLKDSHVLNNTLFILMGDHGPRFSEMRRNTYQGKMEERMAFMAVTLPRDLQLERPRAAAHLRANSQVLTTPFDVHTTALDAMGLRLRASNFTVAGSRMLRGLSMLEPIASSRTCEDAGVLPHWCVCANVRWRDVGATDAAYKALAAALTEFINNATASKRELCAAREIVSVRWVVRRDRSGAARRDSHAYYQMMVVMSPKRAAFEATIRHNVLTDQYIVSDRDISRISAYGKEPACLNGTSPHLDKFCYCIK
ncbi:uncharacterized protein LOC119835936 [Zerene cesonia]|uniref:uncharacterized protein LOC119835936 n=1 Tax=Zerene cesonia TaxID=33412 RepID=UPI0018E5A910|nr:uncharacterized protein LOC119835936 [Zerene cesonia]